MARISIRESLRFRSILLSHYTVIPSNSNNLHSYSSSSSSPVSEDKKTYLYHPALVLFQSCLTMRRLFQIHAHFVTSGLFHNPFLASRVLKHSADFGNIDYTILVFRYIESPDTFCINTVIKAYSNSNAPHLALVFYFEMLRNGVLLNSYSFPPLINSCAKMGCVESGKKCHGQALKNGVEFVLPVQNSLIHMYGCVGLIKIAHKMFDEMSVKDLVSWNSLIDGYVTLGDLDTAHKIFDVMPEKNVVSWNVMIGGYSKSGNPGCTLKLFRQMVKMGARGSDTTVVGVLTACGRSARLQVGRSVHGSLVRTFMKSSLNLDAALMDMYSKCGRVDVACRVFDRMSERNLVCWNVMILGHCIYGNPQDGLKLFEKMVHRTASVGGETSFRISVNSDEGEATISPDKITFIGILCACARSGILEEGRNYFRQMVDVFHIKPNFAHYWCMANLFASIGLIQEAEEAIRNMAEEAEDMSSQSLVWASLLGKCRFQGKVNLGERIGNTLIELQPQNLSCYALLLNVYAVAGRWEDVARVKSTIKERGVGRMPGCSLVDLKELVHNLKVEDQLIDDSQDFNAMVTELGQKRYLSVSSSLYPPCKTKLGS